MSLISVAMYILRYVQFLNEMNHLSLELIVQYLQMVIYKKQDEHQTKCQMLPVILNYWLFVAVTPNYKCD